jgi:hypothetical protein
MKSVDARWSVHVWFWGFVFVFLSHAFAVFWLGDRASFSPAPPRPSAFLFLGGSLDTDAHLAEHAALRDPTLFALPHLNGFSGGAWLDFQPQAPALSNWTAPPEWLPAPIAEPGRTLDQYVATNRLPGDLLTALRTTPAPEIRIPARPLLSHSSVRVLGPLAGRKIAFAPALPNVLTNDVIGSTAVTLSVNRDGIVESASVVHRESGSALADHDALLLARAFLFEPLPAIAATTTSASTFGQLVFTWNTVPPTNSATASPGLGSP